jgi:ABC-type multidrug transport system ATPase subunit
MSLDLSNVSKRFGKLQAVRGVSLKVSPGEGYAIIGPNGAGKTTLIKCLRATGAGPPSAGSPCWR